MKLILLMILCATLVNAETYINEINYDHEGLDNNNEYVEIFSDEDMNLSGFAISDMKSEDILKQVKYFPGNYSLITEDGFNSTGINATVYAVGATIGNGLNNDRDAIILKNKTIIDVVSYSSLNGGSGNGHAICNDRNLWKECLRTPGEENKLETNIVDNITTIVNYTLPKIEISEFLPNPSGKDNELMPNGEWVEIHNLETENVDVDGYFLEDGSGNKITVTPFNANSTSIEAKGYIVVYGNGKSILNNNGDSIRLKDKLKNEIDNVTYSSSKEALSWSRINGLFRITKTSEGYENAEESQNLSSIINIKSIDSGSDKKVKFGDLIYVTINVSKGDTTKNALRVYAKNISKETRFSVYERFKNNTFTLPVQIDPNCDGKHENGFYDVVAEGLGAIATDRIMIEGNSSYCVIKEIKVAEAKAELTGNEATEKVINSDKTTPIELVYRSSDEKAGRTTIYLFSIVMMLILASMVLKKW